MWRALPAALDCGYTHVDLAEGYQNEAAIGRALANYDRDEIFPTSEVLPSNLHYEEVLRSLDASLKALDVEALDLYLIHRPNPAVSLRETIRALERAHEQGLIRNVGASNFSAYQLEFVQKVARVPIAVNQFECHPWHVQQDLVDCRQAHDIAVEAAAPLARGAVLEDPVVAEMAGTHDGMPAQVVLRWAVEKNIVVLPQSTTPTHIRANLDLFEWALDPEDPAHLDARDRGESVYQLDLDDEIYGVPA